MKRKNVALLLAMAMTVATLCGCGASDYTAQSANVSSEASRGRILENITEEAPAEEAAYATAASVEENIYSVAAASTEENIYSADETPVEEAAEMEQSLENIYTDGVPAEDMATTGTMIKRMNTAMKEASAFTEASAMEENGIVDNCAYWEGENYAQLIENSFTQVANSPLSTFGADVDTASYSNFRRMVEDGYRLRDIPRGSIRAEEMINYFSYEYAAPKKGEPFGVSATISDCPWNESTKLVTLGIRAKDIADSSKVASNIVFLVDVSGSMNSYDKLPLLQMGYEMLIDNLDENDRVSIVTYASDSDIVISGVKGNEKSTLKRAMNSLTAQGATNGGSGIKKAYKLAEKYFIEGGNNRIVMATDGDLNVGVTSESELEELISEKKESGIFLSVLGFGTGNYNESKLETLADRGNGNYSYIDSLKEAKKVLIDEFDSTLFAIAKDVKFQLEFNPQYVASYRQIGYENRAMTARDFNDDTKDGGEIGAGHTVTVMYEIELVDKDRNGKNSDDKNEASALRYQNNTLTNLAVESGEWMTVSIRYKNPDEDESKLLAYPVSKECYTKKPSCDTLFASYVAELSMILNHSEYAENIYLDDIVEGLENLELDDEYKEEFLELVKML